jgi:L-lactate dehydrogenase
VAAGEIVDSVLHDEQRAFSASVRAPAGYGIGTEVVLGLPSVVGEDGVERTPVLPRDTEEQRLLDRSAAILADAYRSVAPA